LSAPLPLDAPVQRLAGVGPRMQQRLERLGIRRVADLLFHLPFRYDDRTKICPIGALRDGETALIEAEVELAQVRFGRRRSLMCRVSDGSGALLLRFFHFNRFQQSMLEKGARLRCWGQVRRGPAQFEMIHPEFRKMSGADQDELPGTLTPIYPATEGVSQLTFRRLLDQALEALRREPQGLPELLPADLLRELHLPALHVALQYVHNPPVNADTGALIAGRHPSQRRLAFEELLAHNVSLRALRGAMRRRHAPVLGLREDTTRNFLAGLPFALTAAQRRVLDEVLDDLGKPLPMMRLVQGDVGSGKTVVAACAALVCAAAGWQAAFMAPTDLLAEQHYRNLARWLGEPAGLLLLSGRQKGTARRALLERLREPLPLIAVGTHALFQQQVRFGRLGLVIIDEQHRFGVQQRLALLDKGGVGGAECPHQLIMTATPIPRTLALTVFADLDLSIVDELPPGRKPVRTTVLSNERRAEVIGRIRDVCGAGRQVYWVCPLIEESESLQCRAATEAHAGLCAALPELRVGLLHGRVRAAERDAIMDSFKTGGLDVLVATTVIEVGVDVPNASLIVIENAERLGLSQLHQLRGRVGRGAQDSDCLMLYQPPLGETAQARLEALRRSNDGFVIAEKDLELRGPGELLGTRQTGMQNLRVANLARDAQLLPRVQQAAEYLVRNAAASVRPLVERWVAESTFGAA
jgi:ATP-dependent DNA helicase RecG